MVHDLSSDVKELSRKSESSIKEAKGTLRRDKSMTGVHGRTRHERHSQTKTTKKTNREKEVDTIYIYIYTSIHVASHGHMHLKGF